ncbi:MAG TPA: SOS response-associated peptidase [Bacteroidales bacterium]|nr:SOS response-associated peptidase [Bacteroidales bacterium]
MCYTVEINIPRNELEKRFGARMRDEKDYKPGFFYSAFQLPELPVIAEEGIIDIFTWGLIPFWVKGESQADSIRKKTFNAKAETLQDKPSFRKAFQHNRCLVPAHGFFEWHTLNGKKYPYYIRLKNDEPFTFAGLWDEWVNPETGEVFRTYSIITTDANSLLEKIHNTKKRMPVILKPDAAAAWLNKNGSASGKLALLKAVASDDLTAWPVSPKASDARADRNVHEILEPFHYPDLQTLF